METTKTPPMRTETCPRPNCGYQWLPRTETPKVCPKCHNRIPGR